MLPAIGSEMASNRTGRWANTSSKRSWLVSVVQRLSTGASGTLPSRGRSAGRIWRHGPVIELRARNSVMQWATGWGCWMWRR
jgi:hypothetical protein